MRLKQLALPFSRLQNQSQEIKIAIISDHFFDANRQGTRFTVKMHKIGFHFGSVVPLIHI